jgi:hypothetical protein
MPKMKVTLGIGFHNANQEDVIDIDETEWNECETDEEREDLINDYWQNWANNYIDGGTEIIE